MRRENCAGAKFQFDLNKSILSSTGICLHCNRQIAFYYIYSYCVPQDAKKKINKMYRLKPKSVDNFIDLNSNYRDRR